MANINKPSYIFRYHTDSQGNLINVNVENSYQVSPVNNIVMLDQIPSETERLIIKGANNEVLTECFNIDEITKNTYYCDYNEGKVYFDATHQGKTKIISYYGRGLALISADRVFLPDSLSNGDIIETLQDLIDFGKECLELIKTLGDAVVIIQKLEKNIADGNALNDKLVSNIAIATPLQSSLNKDIKDALVFKDQLKEDVADGKILNTQLNEIVNEGKILKPELDQSLANAQGVIDKVNSAGNKSYLISAEQWATNTDNTISSAFTYRLKHDMASENLQVNGLVSGFSTIVPYKTLGVNEILLISDERVNMKVIINASYYNGGADIAEEVIDARKGESSLKGKINRIDEQIESIVYGSFTDYLKSAKRIKLIGDSITEGTGADGHTVPTSNPIIFDNGSEIFREGDYTCKSFANHFRNFIKLSYPNIQFINAGIGGKSAKWANEIVNGKTNKEYWLDDNEDVVFLQLGTNDRMYCDNITDYERQITLLIDYIQTKCKKLIVMSGTPTINDYNPDGTLGYRFNMWDVDKVLRNVCKAKKITFISNYKKIIELSTMCNISLDYILEVKGSHPRDLGHLAIWENIKDTLNFTERPTVKNNTPKFTSQLLDFYGINDSLESYNYGITYTPISSAKAELVPNAPFLSGGILITYRSSDDNVFSYQLYISASHQYITFKRYYQGSNVWSEWITENTSLLRINSMNGKKLGDYPRGVTHLVKLQGDADMPNSSGGFLITYNLHENKGFGYQEFYEYGTGTKYTRSSDDQGNFLTWSNSGIKTTRVIANFGSVASNKVAGVVIQIPSIDLSKYTYFVSPTSVLDTNWLFSYCVSGTNLYLRILNMGASPTTIDNISFDFTIIKK